MGNTFQTMKTIILILALFSATFAVQHSLDQRRLNKGNRELSYWNEHNQDYFSGVQGMRRLEERCTDSFKCPNYIFRRLRKGNRRLRKGNRELSYWNEHNQDYFSAVQGMRRLECHYRGGCQDYISGVQGMRRRLLHKRK